MKHSMLSALAATAMFAAPALAQDSNNTMDVTLNAPDGSNRGTVTLTDTPNGVLFEAELSGLEPGVHAFHVHENGVCGDDFADAGGHYNPTDAEHGFMVEGGPHAGDMENFTVADDGTATFSSFNAMLRFTQGDAPLDASSGTSLMVHGGADDYMSQPAGDAGDRVACGVIFEAD